MKKTTILVGALIGITSMSLAFIWFGWELCLVLFLAILGNNLEQRK